MQVNCYAKRITRKTTGKKTVRQRTQRSRKTKNATLPECARNVNKIPDVYCDTDYLYRFGNVFQVMASELAFVPCYTVLLPTLPRFRCKKRKIVFVKVAGRSVGAYFVFVLRTFLGAVEIYMDNVPCDTSLLLVCCVYENSEPLRFGFSVYTLFSDRRFNIMILTKKHNGTTIFVKLYGAFCYRTEEFMLY